MVTKFFNRCLESIEVLFGLEGAVARTDRIDMGPPSLVVEVGRLAQASMGFPAVATVSAITAGAGVAVFSATGLAATAFASDSRFTNNLQSRNLEFGELDFWLIGVWATMSAASTGNLSQIICGVEFPQANLEPFLFGLFDTELAPLAAGGRLQLTAGTPERLGRPKWPLLVPPLSRLLVRALDDAGGIVDANIDFVFWATPRGTFPPGA